MFSGDHFPLATNHHNLSTTYQTELVDPVNVQSDRMYVDLHHDRRYELANYFSYSSSGSSPSSYSAVLADDTNSSRGLTQRSVSSHSLPPMMNNDNNHNLQAAVNCQPAANMMHLRTTHRLVDLIDSCSIRRVFSTGDLQLQMHQQHQLSLQHGSSSLSKESSSSSIIKGMLSKARPYSLLLVLCLDPKEQGIRGWMLIAQIFW